jgi:hypothetical protein
MKEIVKCIESLRVQLERHRKGGLKEYPTRTIFIDPLLGALGWDVRDPDDVELAVNSMDRLRDAEAFVRKSFENATRK